MRPALFLGLFLAWLPGPAAHGQDGGPQTAELNYAFASQLGSGIYGVSGRTVQIYRVPFSMRVREPEGRWPAVRVGVKVCLGFFDVDQEAADHFATASITPGVALEFPVRQNWTVAPFVETGVARELEGETDSYLYAVGVKSMVDWRATIGRVLFGTTFVYVGDHTDGVEVDEDFVELETGLELRRTLHRTLRGQPVDWGPYAMSYLYMEPTKVYLEQTPLEVGTQWEIGVTLGTEGTVRVGWFPLPRMGIGYRFGDGVSAVRLVLGAAF